MKKIVITGIALFVLLAGALLVVPGFMDWNKYKPRIIEQLHNATGYDIAIKGDLALSVLPFPQARIQGLSVAMPVELGGWTILTLEQVSASMALWPLLGGHFMVSSVSLEKPVIALILGADGKPAWMTPQLETMAGKNGAAAQPGKPSAADSVALNSIEIRDGQFSLTDTKAGRTTVLSSINATLKADSLHGPYTVEGMLDYQKHTAKISVKTGRFGGEGGSVALSAKATIPNTGTVIGFSGAVTLKQPFEIQGETSVKADNLATLLGLAEIKGSPLSEKPVSLQGLLTASPEALALKDARLSFAGNEAAGSFSVAGLKTAAPGITVEFKAGRPVVFDSFIPAASFKAKAGGKKKTPSFLPESVVLPREFSLKANISVPEAQYKGQSFKNVSLALEKGKNGFSCELKSGLPDGGNVSGSGALSFGSASQNTKDESITFSDPSLSLLAVFESKEPQKVLSLFLPETALAGKEKILASRLTLKAEGVIRPHNVSVKSGTLRLQDTDFDLSGSFALGARGARDSLKLSLAGDGIDADKWLSRLDGRKKDLPVQPTEKAPVPAPDVAAMAAKLILPLDVNLALGFNKVRWGGQDFDKVAFKGKFQGNKLTIDSAGLENQAGGNAVSVAGTVLDIGALKGIDVTIGGKTRDLKTLMQSFGADASKLPQGIDQAEMSSEFKGQADSLAFVTNLKAAGGSLEASGTLAELLKTPKVNDLTVRLRHPDYAALMKMFDPSYSNAVVGKKDLDVYAVVKREGDIYDLSGLKASIGPAGLSGDMRVDRSKPKQVITATLQFADLPLDALVSGDGASGQKGSAKSGSSGGVSSPAQDIRWSHNAFNTAWMNDLFNLDLKATARALSYGSWKIDNVVLDLSLKDGVLDVTKLEGGLYGGQISGTARVKSQDKPRQPLNLKASASLKDVSLESFISSFSGAKIVKSKGMVSLASDFEASGLSPAAMIFDLHGKGVAQGQNLVFEGFDLAQLSRTILQPSGSIKNNFSNILGATMQGGSTGFDTLDSAFTISQGVINFDKLDLTGKDANVKTTGTVNLPLWGVDLNSEIKLATPADAPALRVAFKGPLDQPGKTFGSNVLENYLMEKVGGRLENLLMKKVGKKLGLPAIPGLTTPAPAPSTQEPAAGPEAPAAPVVQPPVAQPQGPVRPEDAFIGILQNVLKDKK